MIFRERNKKIHVIKTVYSAERGRGEQKTMCRFDKVVWHFDLTFNDHLINEMRQNGADDADIEEVKAYITKISDEQKIQRSIEAVQHINSRMKSTLSDLNSDVIVSRFSQSDADDLFSEMKKIRDRLREIGFVEKRAKKKS